MLRHGNVLTAPHRHWITTRRWRALVRCTSVRPELQSGGASGLEVFTGWSTPARPYAGSKAVDVSTAVLNASNGGTGISASMAWIATVWPFGFGGNSAMTQNDHVVELAAGDVVLDRFRRGP